MENALRALAMAAGIAITCGLIAFGLHAADVAKASANRGTKALYSYEERLFENSYIVYEGAAVSGNELINLLRYETNRRRTDNGALAYFEVKNIDSAIITTESDLRNCLDKNSKDYIVPESTYIGETIWKDGLLLALKFSKVN